MKRNTKLSKKKLSIEDAMKRVAKEDFAFFGECSRFQKNDSSKTTNRAIQFLWLKENNVDRKVALQFGNRRMCRFDSTKQIDGPVSARIMKPKKLMLGSINGWHNGAADPQYQLGPGYEANIESERSNISFHFEQDSQVVTSERDKKELEKFQFSKMNPKQLSEELFKLKQQKQSQFSEYIEVGGQKLFHILQQKHNPTLLTELGTFTNTIEQMLRQKEVKSVHFQRQYRQRALTKKEDRIQIPDNLEQDRKSFECQGIYRKKLQTQLHQNLIASDSKGFFNLTKGQTQPSFSSLCDQNYLSQRGSQVSNQTEDFEKKIINLNQEKVQRNSQLSNQTNEFEKKMNTFMIGNFPKYNYRSISPIVDLRNIQKKQDILKLLQQKEMKRMQKNISPVLQSQR